MKKAKRRRFTVIGYYDDNSQIFAEHVNATDWQHAVRLTARKMEKRNDERTIEDKNMLHDNMTLVSVLAGHRTDLNECSGLSSFSDQPGVSYAEEPEEDDGCPKGDPDCLSDNGDCHDACEAPKEVSNA